MVFNRNEKAEITLGIYRICFGLLMAFSLIRFAYKGWIEACYLNPEFHFTYQYFSWIKPSNSPIVMYCAVGIATLLALMIATGICYRIATVLFFLLYTYLELIEQSWYLNHYYFISLVAFLLCFIPADAALSLRSGPRRQVNVFFANVLRLQIAIVYFFAGLAKLRADWLFEAKPLSIWLKSKTDLIPFGQWLAYEETAYLFSYGGLFYDLLIPFFLYWSRSRPFALLAVFGFHLMTWLLFPIGMFPWIMMAGSLIFVSDDEWRKLLTKLSKSILTIKVAMWNGSTIDTGNTVANLATHKADPIDKKIIFPSQLLLLFFAFYFCIQLVLPLRRLAYPENQLWTERHYRFGWNVMLMEKAGTATFRIEDAADGRRWAEYPSARLDQTQQKQMAFQPDMIWQYAQYLKRIYLEKGLMAPKVYVDCWVSLNGRPSQRYLPADLDLTSVSIDEIYDFVLKIEQ